MHFLLSVGAELLISVRGVTWLIPGSVIFFSASYTLGRANRDKEVIKINLSTY